MATASNRRRRIQSVRPRAEALERRILMTTNAWKTAVSGDWDTASNWSLGHIPLAGEDVSIVVPGAYTVTHGAAAADAAASITSDAPLVLSAGRIAVPGVVQVNNTFTFSGGTLTGATIHAGGGGQGITAAAGGGVISGGVVSANISIPDGANISLFDGVALDHDTVTIAGATAATQLIVNSETLGGTGAIVFAGSAPSNDRVFVVNGAGPVTFAQGITIRGAGGTLAINFLAPAFVNKGTIDSDTAGQTITIVGSVDNFGTVKAENGASLALNATFVNEAGASFTVTGGGTLSMGANGPVSSNAGDISETDSTLNLGGSGGSVGMFTSTGRILRSGGTFNLTGVYDLAGGTLAFDAGAGSWNAAGGGVKNATVTFSGGNRLVPTSKGGSLINVTLASTLTLPDATNITIGGGINLRNANIRLKGATAQTSLNLDESAGNQTLGGNGKIVFAGPDPSQDQLFAINGAGVATIGPGIRIRGRGGRIYQNFLAPAYVNQGVVSADVPGTTINIPLSSNFDNRGALEATRGTLALGLYDNTHGSLTIGIGGTTPGTDSGLITVGGALTLGGTINTPLLGGFTPAAGQTLTPLTYTSATGAFANVNTNVGGGFAYTPAVGATSLTLTATSGGPDVADLAGGVLTVNGTPAADTMGAAAGQDVVYGTVGATTAVFFSRRASFVNLLGRGGNDSITVGPGVRPAFVGGGAGDDTIVASNGNDTLGGGLGNDSIRAHAGDNLVRGGAGDDTLFAGAGNDTLLGGKGADSITGGPGNDSIVGGTGPGNDTLVGGSGTDNGVDTILGAAGDSIAGGPNDSIVRS